MVGISTRPAPRRFRGDDLVAVVVDRRNAVVAADVDAGVDGGVTTDPTGAVDALPGSTAGLAFIPQSVQ
jgi:hypothetical protein